MSGTSQSLESMTRLRSIKVIKMIEKILGNPGRQDQRIERHAVFMFYVDGTIADSPHEEAWKQAALMKGVFGKDFDFSPYYARLVAGQPGETGAYNMLAQIPEPEQSFFARGFVLDEEQRIKIAKEFRKSCKDPIVKQLIGEGKSHAYDDICRIVLESKGMGIPTCAVSSSENAEAVLHGIDVKSLCERTGRNYNAISPPSMSLYNMFDARVLGSIKCWHGEKVDKLLHYCMARGAIFDARLRKGYDDSIMPKFVVFEDAAPIMSQLSANDFTCIGISRYSTASGKPLTSPEEFMKNGAKVAYDENQLKTLTINQILYDIGLGKGPTINQI